MFVLIPFSLTSAGILIANQGPITREEAIDISRNTKLVRDLMEKADRYTLEIFYLNKTEVNRFRADYPYSGLLEMYPADRDIWVVMWYIHPKGTASSVADGVNHVIDAETGQILHEGMSGLR
jgi:hypothetical protein